MLDRLYAVSLKVPGLLVLFLCIAGNCTDGAYCTGEKPLGSPKRVVVERDSAQSNLVGLWQCYKQEDRAKLPSCLSSVEFFPDGTIVQKTNVDGYAVEFRSAYWIDGKRINVKDPLAPRHFDFKFLDDGDLYLRTGPWNWKGWLTKDPTRVVEDHGCGPIRDRRAVHSPFGKLTHNRFTV